MNLLDKKKSIGALVLGLFLFVSCENNGPFGLSSDDVAPVDFFSTDIPITSSVVMLDSIQSSATGVYLVGNVTSSTFGRMEAKIYTRLNLNRDQVALVPSESEYDSTEINLQFIYSFDTTAQAKNWGLDVHSINRGIADTIQITTNTSLFANDFLAESELNISAFDSVYAIDFKDRWGGRMGGELFHDLLIDQDEAIESQENFINQFNRGIAIVPKAGFDNNIFGVTVAETSNLTIFYRDPGLEGNIDVERRYIFGFEGVIGYYSLIVDRSGTPLDFIQDTNVEYTPANGKRYVQSGAGIVTKLDLSAFRDFITETPRIINLAEISIGPIDELDDNAPPPSQLFLALTDERNTLIPDQNTFRSIQADGNSPIGNGNPLELNYDEETRTYTGSITTYIQNYFAGIFQRDEFLLYPSNMNTSVNGMSFDAEDIKLKIIYSELQ